MSRPKRAAPARGSTGLDKEFDWPSLPPAAPTTTEDSLLGAFGGALFCASGATGSASAAAAAACAPVKVASGAKGSAAAATAATAATADGKADTSPSSTVQRPRVAPPPSRPLDLQDPRSTLSFSGSGLLILRGALPPASVASVAAMMELTSDAAISASICVPIFNTMTDAMGGTTATQGSQRRQTVLPTRSPPMRVAGVPGASRVVVATESAALKRLRRGRAPDDPSRVLAARLIAAVDVFEAEVGGALRGLLAALLPDHDPSKVAVLRSTTGCERQLLHSDYPPTFGAAPLAAVPFGAILAVQPETRLVVARGSADVASAFAAAAEADDDAEAAGGRAGMATARTVAALGKRRIAVEEVLLAPGDICVFRGDLVHGGSAYSRDNVRVHVYVVPRGEEAPKNETHPLPPGAAFAFVERHVH